MRSDHGEQAGAVVPSDCTAPSRGVGVLVVGALPLIIDGARVAAIAPATTGVSPVRGVGIGGALFAYVLAFFVLGLAFICSGGLDGILGLVLLR